MGEIAAKYLHYVICSLNRKLCMIIASPCISCEVGMLGVLRELAFGDCNYSSFINPRRACAARVTVVVLCVCVCVSTYSRATGTKPAHER